MDAFSHICNSESFGSLTVYFATDDKCLKHHHTTTKSNNNWLTDCATTRQLHSDFSIAAKENQQALKWYKDNVSMPKHLWVTTLIVERFIEYVQYPSKRDADSAMPPGVPVRGLICFAVNHGLVKDGTVTSRGGFAFNSFLPVSDCLLSVSCR